MIETQFEAAQLHIVIDQQAKLNAINRAMWVQLADALADATRRVDVAMVCLRGAGRRAFCAGGDITEYEDLARDVGKAGQVYVGVRDVSDLLRGLDCPTLAAISGYCVGAGLVLAAACDFRLCTRGASFSVTAVKRGLVYPAPAAGDLLGLVGLGATRDILLRGRKLDGARAHALGLVDELVNDADFETATADMCAELGGLSGLAYAASKQSIRHALQLAAEDAAMRQLHLESLRSDRFVEATRDFLRRD